MAKARADEIIELRPGTDHEEACAVAGEAILAQADNLLVICDGQGHVSHGNV